MLLFLFRLLAHVPLRLLHGIGCVGGRIVYALPGKYRRRLRDNARQAGYSDAAFARRAAAQTGAMIMELPKVWLRTEQCLDKIIAGDDDMAIVADAVAQGRGVLCLTPHLGGFEIAARYMAAVHGPMTVMFRPPRKDMLRPIMEQARNSTTLNAVPANMKGVREFVRALRHGGVVGLLPDQAPGSGEGVWVPFFGRSAYTMTLPGKLAAQTHVPVIAAAGERLPHGRGWRVHVLRLPEPLPAGPDQQAELVNQTMEALIRRMPDQYLWGYNRYKRPKGAPPPPST